MKIENLYEALKSSELVTELECEVIEKDQFYVSITHHWDLVGDSVYNKLCDRAETESLDCIDREAKMYETQLIFNIS